MNRRLSFNSCPFKFKVCFFFANLFNIYPTIELYKDPSRRLKGTGKTDVEQKAWDEERQRYQRQLVNLRLVVLKPIVLMYHLITRYKLYRKEVTMAAIREKDACVQLLQGPPDSTKEKIEILLRQKEQLRHRLLTQNSESYSVSEGGPYLANVWFAAQQPEPSGYPLQQHHQSAHFSALSKMPSHRIQPSYSSYVNAGLPQNGSPFNTI